MAIDSQYGPDHSLDSERPHSPEIKEPPGVVKLRPHQKLRSYQDILEDFEAHERGDIDFALQENVSKDDVQDWRASEEEDDLRREEYLRSRLSFAHALPSSLSSTPQTASPTRRKEDTVRRQKRYSVPAVSLHTTQVMARASVVVDDGDAVEVDNETPTRQRRFSLVLSPSKSGHKLGNRLSVAGAVREAEEEGEGATRSVAADHLSQLLSKSALERG